MWISNTATAIMMVPITFVLLTIVWLLLTRVFFRFEESFEVVTSPPFLRSGQALP